MAAFAAAGRVKGLGYTTRLEARPALSPVQAQRAQAQYRPSLYSIGLYTVYCVVFSVLCSVSTCTQ